MFACKPLRFLNFLYLFARAFGIPFVKKVGKGGKFIALKAASVHVIHDGDEPHARFGIDDFGVRADLNIIPAEA